MYLVDSNVLIQAKNNYYPMDVVPGFWAWIERCHAESGTYSVRKVLEEINKGNDEITVWANSLPNSFFLAPDEPTLQSMMVLTQWTKGSKYNLMAQNTFLGVAYYYLIAHALAHQCTIVTEEKSQPNKVTAMKIPDICNEFGVLSISTFQWLKKEKAKFVLA